MVSSTGHSETTDRNGRKGDKTYGGQDCLQLRGVVHCPRSLGLQSNAGTVGATALVTTTEGRGGTPGHRDQVRNGHAVGGKDLCLQCGLVGSGDRGVCHGGERILPNEALLRHVRAEVAGDRTHITMEELDCCFPE